MRIHWNWSNDSGMNMKGGQNEKRKISGNRNKNRGDHHRISSRGVDSSSVITVAYEAGGVAYSVTESVRMKSETIRLGPIPIGQRQVPVMGAVEEGTKVTVIYDPKDPRKAVIGENRRTVKKIFV